MSPALAPETDGARARAIATFNDAFRRTFVGGQVVITRGVAALPAGSQLKLLAAVRAFDTFTPANSPYQEHDFGAVELGGETFFWKIDAYDIDLRGHSPDAADPAVTRRVLTIMTAEEY